MTHASALRRFLHDERGEIYVGFSYVLLTLVVAIPLGLFWGHLHEALCVAAQKASLLINLF